MTDRDAANFPLATAITRILHDEIDPLVEGMPSDLLDRVTPITSELLRYWFQEDFCETRQLNFHKGQRAAILAIIYAHEVLGSTSLLDLYERLAPDALLENGLLGDLANAEHQHPKYAAKMATGTGKTWVLNALLVWQYLNHLDNPADRRFTRNFLLVAPGLIVYDRLLDSFQGKERGGVRDFTTSDIARYQDLFIPETYREAIFGFVQASVVTKSEIGRKVTGGGLIAITNWHLLSGEEDPTFVDDEDIAADGTDIDEQAAIESFFPITPGTNTGNSLATLDRAFARGLPLQSLVDLPDLMVFNDEAHHIHSGTRAGEVYEVEWQKSLNQIASTKGSRFVQIDFSATPFNEIGSGRRAKRRWFPHIVVDFDLRMAMRSGLVKSLALDKRKEVASLPLDFKAERDERNNVVGLSEGQRVMLSAGLTKLNRLEQDFSGFDAAKHPKMLVVCEDTKVTPFVVEFFKQAGLGEDDILQVDSNRKGELGPAQWEPIRERLFNVDQFAQPKVIVSVLMLREGFDVNNICVIVPLRANEASILLEQTIGRGLRLMWRGQPEIDALKQETRSRIANRLEPTNFFDVLFIIEHPAFSDFYDDLLDEGLAGEVGDGADSTSALGDIESIGLRDGYEEFDILVPMILRDEEEEMQDPSIDPMSLPPMGIPLSVLRPLAGTGDRFVSHDAQTGTLFGDYRVNGGIMTATGYNDYLGRMTRRIAEALTSGITKSARSYNQATQFPGLQISLPLLTGWIDTYIRERLFDQPFEPLEDEQWRVLLLDDVAQHISGRFASALVESEGNVTVGSAEVRHRALSEVDHITVRASSSIEVVKSIYPKLPIPKRAGGLERTFIEWADQDSEVKAFAKVDEYKHAFLQHRYLKEDGMPGMYSPDFLLRTDDHVYIIETKAQNQVSNANVQRKRKAAKAWCDRINQLDRAFRFNRVWSYVILGEESVGYWRSRNARLTELLNYAQLTDAAEGSQGRLL
ncbi:MAG: DEAD/DEAH box helicase family protein [Thermomicrobiales bacterium]